MASHDFICYANADIILLSDFMGAAQQVASWRPSFLMIGRQWNIDLSDRIEFERPYWESRLRTTVLQRGKRLGSEAVDYFLFSPVFFEVFLLSP